MSEQNLHKGHRQRMREKLLSFGSKSMQSHELLEMLLYYAIPYKNTNDIAKRLMLRFGSLDGVLSASVDELCGVEGVGEGIAAFIKKADRLLCDNNEAEPESPFDNFDKVGAFLLDILSAENENKTVMLALDNKMRLVDFKTLYDLDYSSGAVKPDTFIDFAVKTRATVAITAHNHPHGPLFPTAGDMATNNLISGALSLIGVNHVEHYIVCGNRYMGISKQVLLKFVQSPALERFYESRRNSGNG